MLSRASTGVSSTARMVDRLHTGERQGLGGSGGRDLGRQQQVSAHNSQQAMPASISPLIPSPSTH